MAITDDNLLVAMLLFFIVFTIGGLFRTVKAYHDMRRAKKKYERFIREIEREEDEEG